MRFFDWWRKIAGAHRSDDDTERGRLQEFFLPQLTKGFFLRLGSVALLAFLFFRFLLMPCIIDGASMMPTYDRHGFTFCRLWSYWFASPGRGDIVVIAYAPRLYLLKRVVALAGDTVEFRDGTLIVNGIPQEEPYVRYVSNWQLPPRIVEPGNCYVVGDNRSQPIREHVFGQVPVSRIKGKPLF